jgi:hypothetical protein
VLINHPAVCKSCKLKRESKKYKEQGTVPKMEEDDDAFLYGGDAEVAENGSKEVSVDGQAKTHDITKEEGQASQLPGKAVEGGGEEDNGGEGDDDDDDDDDDEEDSDSVSKLRLF